VTDRADSTAREKGHTDKYLAIPLSAALLWYLIVYGSYVRVERLFLAMTLVFFAYPAAALMAHPQWPAVARGALLPTFHRDPNYLFLLVGLLGTTITPYMQLFQQSSLVEKGVARRHYGPERIDTYAGSLLSNLMSMSMIIATAATLHVKGQTAIDTAIDAARALEPVVGNAASLLFALGLLGASLLAGAVLPLATAYAVCEAFGVPKGINLDFRRARVFFTLFTLLLVLGAGVALLPQLPVIPLLLVMQVLNGVLLPIILVFILVLSNDARVAGELKKLPARQSPWLGDLGHDYGGSRAPTRQPAAHNGGGLTCRAPLTLRVQGNAENREGSTFPTPVTFRRGQHSGDQEHLNVLPWLCDEPVLSVIGRREMFPAPHLSPRR
jgi:Mn2+/Fe2+ NRAMP family transporter